jgi:hypothetical protein
MNNLAPWNGSIKTPIWPTPEGIGAKIDPASPTTVADFHALGYAPLVVGAGIDIQLGRGLVAIYANTMDLELAGLIRMTVFEHFDTTPIRLGNGPPALYLIATSRPIERVCVEFGELDNNGRLKDRVDILSEGCQFVASGNPYVWVCPLVARDQLIVFSPAQIVDFLKALRLVLPVAATPRTTEGVSNVSPASPLSAAKPLRTEGAASNVNQGVISPLSEEIKALVDHGFLPYLRPYAPPAVELHTRRGVKISDGKLPSTYAAGRWFDLPAWLTYEPKASDVLEWSTWPGAGLCLVTGDVCAFDIDIKFAWDDESESAKRGRLCIKEIGKVLTVKLACAVPDVPVRKRENSSSCAVFVRVSSRVEKQVVTLFEAGSDRKHKVEFLASGQQIVIAGLHDSGVRVKSTFSAVPLDRIPTISAETLQEIMAEIAAVAQRHGYSIEKKAPLQARGARGVMNPDQAVAREIMRRRAEWVPSLLPVAAGKADQEWRISSAELERELDEDLCIYPDGIHDHGTERSHTVVSFIREFGAIEAGEISFGGCPQYGRRGKVEFAVIGEFDPAPKRPTEAEALSWLCKQLAGGTFPELPVDATWSTSWRAVAAAVGLDWRALEALQVHLLLDDIDEAGVARPFKPAEWSADELKRNGWLLPAIRATNPVWLAKLEFAWDFTGATSSAEVSTAIAEDAARVRERAVTAGHVGLFEESPPLAPEIIEFAEPLDIFSDADPAELANPPPGSLPPMIELWARTESRRKGVPYIFAAAAAIGVASSAVGSSLRIAPRVHDEWTEPAALWLALVVIRAARSRRSSARLLIRCAGSTANAGKWTRRSTTPGSRLQRKKERIIQTRAVNRLFDAMSWTTSRWSARCGSTPTIRAACFEPPTNCSACSARSARTRKAPKGTAAKCCACSRARKSSSIV